MRDGVGLVGSGGGTRTHAAYSRCQASASEAANGRLKSTSTCVMTSAPGPTLNRSRAVRLAAAGQDEHHGPFGPAEHPLKRLFVGPARLRRAARMGVDPDPAELLRLAAGVDLGVKEVGHRLVVERHVDRRASLPDQADVFHQQEVVRAT